VSRKLVIKNYKMLDGVSATTTQTSTPTNVDNVDNMTIHCKFSANNTGTFKVEARNYVPDNGDTSTLWYELDFDQTVAVTAESEIQIVLNALPFRQIRLVWTPSAGSGTLTAYAVAKTVGA
jgi:hypothetical protein